MADGCVHDLVCCHTADHSDVAEERGDDDALGDDELQYRPRFGTDGFSYAKLSGSLLYGDEHDVAYAHDAAQQSEQTYYPEGSLHDGDSLVHLDIVHVSVPEPDGAIVIRCSLVVVVDAGTIVLLKLLVIFLGLQILDGELQTSCIIALGVDGLDGGVGDESIGIVARFIILVNSYHLEVEVADLYVLAHQRTVVFAEFLGLASAQHHILALLLHIDFVDESSGNHLRLVDFGMCRSHTHQRLACHIIIAIIDVHVILFQSSTHIIHVLAVGLVADEDVPVVERDASAFLQSLVSLGGFAREYSHGVGKESGALLQLGIN